MMLAAAAWAQTSPHGAGFKVNCMSCHSTATWKIDLKTLTFNHGETRFPLVGQHQAVSCRQCHTTLEFARVGKECIDCHTDLHNNSVGPECSRCHSPVSWIVNNVSEIHRRSRFPLTGPHAAADCYDCHVNASPSLLDFQPLGVNCYDCHSNDYASAKSPDHAAGNYSTNCTECHTMNAFSWTGAGINHNFFPLTLGHALNDCSQCHKTPDYSSTSPVCLSCHQPDYNGTTNPNHASLGFPTECQQCHTTNPGWKPAEYRDHDARSFPIYSGRHQGEWNSCADCHPNPAVYAEFTCISCHDHNKTDMDDEHNGVQGYTYSSPECLACHPTGSAEETFNHASSGFPLTGAHSAAECAGCHSAGYAGTPTQCSGCHMPDYNQSVNPGHITLGLPTECNTCHTSDPGWAPATFAIHNNYYVLAGAHTAIGNQCADCHQGNYNNTPNTCEGCHLDAYNQTSDPSHAAAQFPTTCGDCHTQSAWRPANWDHDNQYFPIYSGKHDGEWNSCADCHTNPANYSVFTCTTACHPKPDMDDEHNDVSGYAYNSAACFSCHPNGSGGKLFRLPDRID